MFFCLCVHNPCPSRQRAREMEAKGDEKLERQRQAPEGACLPPKAAGGLPLTPLCPLLTPIPPQPASVNRIQKVTQSPGSEFLENPGWGLLEAERAQIKIRYPQPSHLVGGGGKGGSGAICLLKPGLSTGLQNVSNWLPVQPREPQEWESNQTQVESQSHNFSGFLLLPPRTWEETAVAWSMRAFPMGRNLVARVPPPSPHRCLETSDPRPRSQDLDKGLIAFCFPQGQWKKKPTQAHWDREKRRAENTQRGGDKGPFRALRLWGDTG